MLGVAAPARDWFPALPLARKLCSSCSDTPADAATPAHFSGLDRAAKAGSLRRACVREPTRSPWASVVSGAPDPVWTEE
ncbi:hypothetical protein GCM10022236_22670 [Microlunatus ginsengisoli]|uniref:Secreted protein n=1 Tax=Microlunatus ginsengisoli TaxID=363863 RepID=A0ABP6ZVN0_9ACTN